MRWLIVVLVGLFACGDDADSSMCASPADCAEGERCVNGLCVSPEVDAGEDDAGSDAGDDASSDASSDVGSDAPVDVPVDVSVDVPMDVGPILACGPGGDREDPLVLYNFRAPDTAVVITDRAPAAPDVPLTDNSGLFMLDTSGSGSVTLEGGMLAATIEASDPLTSELVAAGSFTVEAWAQAADLMNEGQSPPERIVTLSLDSSDRAFTLGVDREDVITRVRTNTTRSSGSRCDEPVVGDASPPSAEIVGANEIDAMPPPKHLVLVFDSAVGAPRLYVDGVPYGDDWPCRRGTLNWETLLYRLAVGGEFEANRFFEGTVHRVAIYARPMSEEEVGCWFARGHLADIYL